MSCTLLYVCAGFLGDISEEITFPAWHTGNQGHFFFEKKKEKCKRQIIIYTKINSNTYAFPSKNIYA